MQSIPGDRVFEISRKLLIDPLGKQSPDIGGVGMSALKRARFRRSARAIGAQTWVVVTVLSAKRRRIVRSI